MGKKYLLQEIIYKINENDNAKAQSHKEQSQNFMKSIKDLGLIIICIFTSEESLITNNWIL